MDITGQHTIQASPERVFEALNDESVLRQCIPGCQRLERLSDDEMAATVVVKIGAMPAKFNCTVKISDRVYPESYRITGQGGAGAAGAAKGSADVSLTPDPQGTLLRYEVRTELDGMLKKFGTSLLDSIARDLSTQFFEKFSDHIAGSPGEIEPARPAVTVPNIGLPGWIWWLAAGLVILLLITALSL